MLSIFISKTLCDMQYDLFETIESRHSVRSFDGNPVTASQYESLQSLIQKLTADEAGGLTLSIHNYTAEEGNPPSTYGVIRDARTYLLMSVGGNIDIHNEALMRGGYILEQVVIRATAMGLGSCWLGGTFKGSTFERGVIVPSDEKLVIVIPVGTPAKRKSLLDRITKAIARSSTRKPFETMFYLNDFEHPMATDADRHNCKWTKALEMMRLAPSSLNSQPWLAVACEDCVHVYGRLKNFMHRVDVGIGMSHLAMSAEAMGLKGRWIKSEIWPEASRAAALTYIGTYKL